MTNTSKASVDDTHSTSTNMSAIPGKGVWTYLIVAGDISNESREFNIEPQLEDLPDLAKALDVASVISIHASMTLHRTKKSIRIRGEVRAVVDQNCIVTLEPVRQKFSEEIDRTFVASRDEVEKVFKKMNSNREMMIDPDEIDPPEVVENGRIDLAAIALEHVILGIDLYPRAQGVEADDTSSMVVVHTDESAEEEIVKESPFAALARLKANTDNEG